ncbi:MULTISPECIES: hypothetical protein [Vibrio]|uniref:Uncharacterized protein n=1 Tax=Vibrio mediterranei TaxID=689 RepID=A0A3G4VIG8_9VIBR|nr:MULTISPECIES: hypothetical protein [Vibrio]AYV24593.1 hypothetical protein ECB94_25425 [Vibrio mediterranei]EDL52910.1 hypothetical protein VSAK1_14927 [Vibrio mediterranei AK1]MCF4174476.1 hypothetical protein [Vibrio sp. McD22-P3]MCY9853819.1 hypothetical protein [Vibrio mediterranei]MDA0107564.1 hypothetical protein [Vibrio sp. La 4.2.2]
MNTKYITLLIAFGTLTACGGGGGGGGDSSGGGSTGNTTEAAPEPVPAPVTVSVSRTMGDLSIPDTLDYKPIEDYSLDIDASNDVTGRAFASVYTEYEDDGSGVLTPVYDSKIASTSLNNGSAQIDFSAAEHVDAFLVEIWTYDGNPPAQKLVSASSNNLAW